MQAAQECLRVQPQQLRVAGVSEAQLEAKQLQHPPNQEHIHAHQRQEIFPPLVRTSQDEKGSKVVEKEKRNGDR